MVESVHALRLVQAFYNENPVAAKGIKSDNLPAMGEKKPTKFKHPR